MANVTVQGGQIVEITGLDADWVWSTELSDFAHMPGIVIQSIQFVPSSANDTMIVRDGAVGGATLFNAVAPYTAMQCTKYFNPPIECAPIIDISECTLGTPADAKVIIVLA